MFGWLLDCEEVWRLVVVRMVTRMVSEVKDVHAVAEHRSVVIPHSYAQLF